MKGSPRARVRPYTLTAGETRQVGAGCPHYVVMPQFWARSSGARASSPHRVRPRMAALPGYAPEAEPLRCVALCSWHANQLMVAYVGCRKRALVSECGKGTWKGRGKGKKARKWKKDAILTERTYRS